MRFDDRLLTVLNQSAGDRHDAAVRWRQLVDLVARAGAASNTPTIVRALDAIKADGPNVETHLRAAAARAVAALPLPLGLLEYFASDSLVVSAPVLAAATLDPDQWRTLLALADDETRHFVETLHPELAPAPTPDLTETLVEPRPEPEAPPPSQAGPSLSDVVARIERRRRSRMVAKGARDGPPVSPAGSPALFRWECGPSGEIAWVEGAPRGPLIGRSIAKANGDGVDREVVRAFAMRAPFRDAGLVLGGEGALSGEWRISGVPEFESSDGRFAGYRGVALRDAPVDEPQDFQSELLADPDSLRELVHEIKTPLNAIIGFAEIIDNQYLGPADHRYRERAAEIVAQARLLLTAIDDLDFAAKVHSSDKRERPQTNIGDLVQRMAPSLRELALKREAVFETTRVARDLNARIEPELADRLIYRICEAMIEQSVEGERLRMSANRSGDHVRVSISRPAALRGQSEEELFGGTEGTADAFYLRLVRGLAGVAGAGLSASSGAVMLTFARA